jgi:hypothetical protein
MVGERGRRGSVELARQSTGAFGIMMIALPIGLVARPTVLLTTATAGGI